MVAPTACVNAAAQRRRVAQDGFGHCASLISDVYLQEGARMLVVSRCWVSDHAAIASKSKDTEAATLDEARRNYFFSKLHFY
jgi:hypothetical protein